MKLVQKIIDAFSKAQTLCHQIRPYRMCICYSCHSLSFTQLHVHFVFRSLSICSSLAAAWDGTSSLLSLPWLLSQEPQEGLDSCLFYICIHGAWWCLLCNNKKLSWVHMHDTLQKYLAYYALPVPIGCVTWLGPSTHDAQNDRNPI